MAKIRNLSDILPPELKERETASFTDFIGKDLIIRSVQDVSGNNGAYKRITVSLPDSEDMFVLSTGAKQPMQVLDWATKNGAYPFSGKFVKAGRAYLLVGTE